MSRQIEQLLLREGYRFCKAWTPEAGIFYKYYQQGFHVVLAVDLKEGAYMTPEQHRQHEEWVMDLFYHPQGRLADFPEGFPVYHVEMLTLIVGGNSQMVRELCRQRRNIWNYQPKEGRLLIYENQIGDFWGLQREIEQITPTRKTKWNQLPYAVILLAAVNVVVYIVLEVMGDTQDALFIASHGGMSPELIRYNQQWWRILTAMFIHFGLPHLVNNMVIFCCVGSRLERAVGHWKLLVIYLLSGIGGGLLSLAVMLWKMEYAVSAGASGAVFGVIGALLWVVIRNRGRFEGLTTRGMAFMAVLSLYYGFSTIGVDNWCHIGGLITGFVTAVILYHGEKKHAA